MPLVAHPDVYPEIEDGVTGVHARTPEEVEAALLRLIDDAEERERIGRQAHEDVAEHRRIEVAAAELGRSPARGPRGSPRRRLVRKFLQVCSNLPTTSVSQGRRSKEHIGHPRPLPSACSR